jgi:hypothetical protein
MSDWSNNNRAHNALWYSLRVLGELDVGFATAGTLKVEDLTYWNNLGSEEHRKQHAQTLSIQLNNMFIMIFRASFEDGITPDAAIADLYKGLSSGSTTLPELGETADAAYRFRGEEIQ